MKVITLTQPWAALVAVGAKTIETRSWRTSYRGLIGIHAAKTFTGADQSQCLVPSFLHALKKAGFLASTELPLGKIVAVCHLVDCLEIPPVTIEWRAEQKTSGERLPDLDFRLPPDAPELDFGNYAPGRFAWFLKDVRVLRDPIPAKGALSLWRYETKLRSECEALGICPACGEELPRNASEFGGFCDPLCVEMWKQ